MPWEVLREKRATRISNENDSEGFGMQKKGHDGQRAGEAGEKETKRSSSEGDRVRALVKLYAEGQRPPVRGHIVFHGELPVVAVAFASCRASTPFHVLFFSSGRCLGLRAATGIDLSHLMLSFPIFRVHNTSAW